MDEFEKGILAELGGDTSPVEDPNGRPMDLKVDYDLPKVEDGKRSQFEEGLVQNLVARDASLMEEPLVESAPPPAPKPTNLPKGVPLVRFKHRLPTGDSDSAINIATRKSDAKVRVLDSDHGRFYQFESNEEAEHAIEILEAYGIGVELLTNS